MGNPRTPAGAPAALPKCTLESGMSTRRSRRCEDGDPKDNPWEEDKLCPDFPSIAGRAYQQILAVDCEPSPCVDCGLTTGRFCDGDELRWTGSAKGLGIGQPCLARCRVPGRRWADGQRTPLCSFCDNFRGACHYCRGAAWCAMPAREGMQLFEAGSECWPGNPEYQDPAGHPTERYGQTGTSAGTAQPS